uniref:Uncharacterized protein n=1 Tax=Physcomitrium patens TaxID=3218 RepID=A0A2K1J7J4_PHYPA|nr:hypothetical protein PHYPA_020601 [Physcomitrium patens]
MDRLRFSFQSITWTRSRHCQLSFPCAQFWSYRCIASLQDVHLANNPFCEGLLEPFLKHLKVHHNSSRSLLDLRTFNEKHSAPCTQTRSWRVPFKARNVIALLLSRRFTRDNEAEWDVPILQHCLLKARPRSIQSLGRSLAPDKYMLSLMFLRSVISFLNFEPIF